ncbi:MAG TPA: ribosome maturation factor RimP [Bacillales bacterium]|nr:ribosome maturation factor RimP [Bacillales bacterium]HEU5140835.1 ribosome maturation factor RimP [Bacillales bacterium]
MGESIKDVTEALAAPIVGEMNLELVDVEFVKEGSNWYLRVYIDSESGVDLDECTEVSEQLSQKLDERNLIEQAYFLEVSSPGAERPLKKEKDFREAIGKQVRITTYTKIDGEKAFEGELVGYDGDHLRLAVQRKTRKLEVEIPYEKVASARLAVVFH